MINNAGPNPLFGGLKTAKSVFGRSSHMWVEGEGMLHVLHFSKDTTSSDDDHCKWSVRYNNKHVETETLELEKQRPKPSFIPVTEGDSLAIMFACLLNMVSTTNIITYKFRTLVIFKNYLDINSTS